MSFHLFTGANVAKRLQSGDLIAIENAGVEVRNLAGDIVNLFQDKLGTIPQPNPFTANDTGGFYFYIEKGEFDLTISKGGVSSTIVIEFLESGEVIPVNIETNALVVGDDSHGILYSITDITGSVSVTVEVVSANSVGNIVFIHSDTDSVIQFVPGAGMTIETPSGLLMSKFSTAAIMWQSETVSILMGGIEA